MDDSTPSPKVGTSRRRILRSSALGILGLAAGGAAGAAAGERGAQEAPGAVGGATTVVLHGVDWRLHRPTALPGSLPSASDGAATHGRLQDDAGKDVGHFRSAGVPGAAGSMTLHTFELEDGTLLGMGTGQLAEGAFAVVGGTGRYAGASGAYTARQRPREAGGDGTAEFELQLRTDG